MSDKAPLNFISDLELRSALVSAVKNALTLPDSTYNDSVATITAQASAMDVNTLISRVLAGEQPDENDKPLEGAIKKILKLPLPDNVARIIEEIRTTIMNNSFFEQMRSEVKSFLETIPYGQTIEGNIPVTLIAGKGELTVPVTISKERDSSEKNERDLWTLTIYIWDKELIIKFISDFTVMHTSFPAFRPGGDTQKKFHTMMKTMRGNLIPILELLMVNY